MGKAPNPKPKLVWTDKQIDLVRRMTAEGRSREETAAALGCSVQSLRRHFRDLLGQRRIGAQPILWTQQQRRIVAALAGFGAAPAEIGRLLGITQKRVMRDFEQEIDSASTEVNARVATALFHAATNGNVSAAIFWLRTRAGWDDSAVRRRSLDEGATPPGERTPEVSPEATRSNIREAARHLSAAGRAALRTVVDELQSNEARIVSG
ncbi:hypothetical protein K2X89_13550 [Myxococcota bacterium]|nr:hypothetical protein [Myxococcota bacterium]